MTSSVITKMPGACRRVASPAAHGRTIEKDNGQTRWYNRYDGEHRLTEVSSQPRDRNKPQTQVSFRYDPLCRRISKTRQQMLGGQPTVKPVTTRFVWAGFCMLQEVHGDVPLTYVYIDQDSYDPLARMTALTPRRFSGSTAIPTAWRSG